MVYTRAQNERENVAGARFGRKSRSLHHVSKAWCGLPQHHSRAAAPFFAAGKKQCTSSSSWVEEKKSICFAISKEFFGVFFAAGVFLFSICMCCFRLRWLIWGWFPPFA